MYTKEVYKTYFESLKKLNNWKMILSIAQVIIVVCTFVMDFIIGYVWAGHYNLLFLFAWIAITCGGYMINRLTTSIIERKIGTYCIVAKYYHDKLLS